MSAVRGVLLVGVICLLATSARADFRFRNFDDPDEVKWEERETSLPAAPRDEDLLEFFVSAVTSNRFFVDAKSLSVGTDGVVRFSLIVKTSGGATNVTFEGIRCESREHKLYATGRADGNWAKARTAEWRPIVNKPVNRHHASLSRDYFCPNGSPIRTADEGRDALERGKHPNAE